MGTGEGGQGNITALAIQGKTIDKIAVFNSQFGLWVEQRLLQPVEGEINPIVLGGNVLYQAGNDFYALNERRLGFVILHLEGTEEATVSFTYWDIEVMQGNRLYVFSPKIGEWSKGVDAYRRPIPDSPDRDQPAQAGKASQ